MYSPTPRLTHRLRVGSPSQELLESAEHACDDWRFGQDPSHMSFAEVLVTA